MKTSLPFYILFFVCSLIFANDLSAQSKLFTDAKELSLIGKAMPTSGHYHRIDTARYSEMPVAVKNLFTNSAGLAICFSTNSTSISAKWCVTTRSPGSNMTPIANKGLDLYIKKDDVWQFAGAGRPNSTCTETTIVQNMNADNKECLLYLPLYDETISLAIGTDNHSYIKALPDPFRKKIVIYGSSILQGASASRPGLAYPARLCRETGLNFINLGLSGNGKMEKPVIDMLADIEADAFILDCIPNPSPGEIKTRTEYMIETLSKRHPGVPLIVIASSVRENGYFDNVIGTRNREQNEAIRQEMKRLKVKHPKNLYFIDEDHFLGTDHEGTVDGVHPNDLGFDRMFSKTKPQILKILKKHGIH